jgi:hypothetical protein
MPLVRYFKEARVREFHRSRRLKGRPEWQDMVPETQAGRDAYAIAAKHEQRFSRAFLHAVRDMLPQQPPKQFRTAWRTGSISEMLNSLPLFNEGSTDQDKVWRQFMDKIKDAYAVVIQDAGDAATKEMNGEFKTNMKFSLEPVKKAARKVVPVVPINPYSVEWIEANALDLVKDGVTKQQKFVVTDIIQDAFEEGDRMEEVYAEIRRNIGLTRRENRAVVNRQILLEEGGYSPEEVFRLSDKYRTTLLAKRAQRIARTETIKAQAHGRLTAWKMAKDEGQLPEVQREWSTPPLSPNPYRPCKICLELNGQRTGLDEPYESSFIGSVEGQPAHPQCRCTEFLVRKEDGE